LVRRLLEHNTNIYHKSNGCAVGHLLFRSFHAAKFLSLMDKWRLFEFVYQVQRLEELAQTIEQNFPIDDVTISLENYEVKGQLHVDDLLEMSRMLHAASRQSLDSSIYLMKACKAISARVKGLADEIRRKN
jgi:hypothetical protein